MRGSGLQIGPEGGCALWVILQCKAFGDRFGELGRGLVSGVGRTNLGDLACQFGDAFNGFDRLCLRDHTILDEQVKKTLTKHQGNTALRIRHR
jgi:hypothetical protein